MAYAPDWEPLASAVNRVVAAGATKDQAKRDLCLAIADGKIAARVRLAAKPHQPEIALLSGVHIDVPSHLSSKDLDWRHSRPIKHWPIAQIRPGESVMMFISRAGHLVERTIDLIELCTSDVTTVLCVTRSNSINESVRGGPDFKSRLGAKTRGIADAINELWHGKIPKGLSAKDRNKAIIDWLRENGCSIPANPERAIQRVLKNQRSN